MKKLQKIFSRAVGVAVFAGLIHTTTAQEMKYTITEPAFHLGLVDGSAGIAVSGNRFITISDEINDITEYSTEPGSVGKSVLNLNDQKGWFKALPKKKSNEFYEADIESAAQVGEDTVYWISSHACAGDDKTGGTKQRSERQVFFATKFEQIGEKLKPVPTGKVYRELLVDLIACESLKKYDLEAASRELPKKGPTPKNLDIKPGLNIESLCTAEDGKTLLIGFRNPIPGGKALLVPLENPAALVDEKSAEKAKFGAPVQIDLGGLGLRDMLWWKGKYLIIAGHYDGHLDDQKGDPRPDISASKLFRWSGKTSDKPVPLDVDLNLYNPEALIRFPDDRVLILSDDGAFQKDALKNGNPVHFRSVWLKETE